jgi:hypothetical protein
MADQNFAFHVLKNPGTVTASASGLGSAPTLDGSGLGSIDDAFGTYLEHFTGPGQNSAAGLITTFDVLAAGWRPVIEFEVQLPSAATLANTRLWIGLFSQRPDPLVPTTASLPGPHLAAFYRGPDGPASANWRAVTSNATQKDDLNTGVAAVANARVRLRIESDGGSPPGAIRFFINDAGAPQATSTKLPDLAKLLGIGIRATNLGSGVATKVCWNRVSWRYLVRLA